jgi:hypothetical protein
MSQKLVRAALETRLKNWAETRQTPLPVAWENMAFVPPKYDPNDPESGCYLIPALLPAETTSEDLAGQHRRYLGLFQIGIIVPGGRGSGMAERIVADLDALFPCSLRIEYQSIEVLVLTPLSAAAGFPDESNYFVPTSFQYRADVI